MSKQMLQYSPTHQLFPGDKKMRAPTVHTRMKRNIVTDEILGGPTQHFWRKTLVPTLRSFFMTPRILTPGQPPKVTDCSLFQLPP